MDRLGYQESGADTENEVRARLAKF